MVLKMKGIKRTLGSVTLAVSIGMTGYAQKGDLVYAEKQYGQENYRQAAVEYGRVYSYAPGYSVARKAAESLDRIYEFSLSRAWWTKVVEYPEATREDYLSLLQSVIRSESGADLGAILSGSAYRLSDFPELGARVSVSEVPYRAYELSGLDELNSSGSDYGLYQGSSGTRLFASNRGDVSENKKKAIRLDAKGRRISKEGYHSDQRSYYGLYSQEGKGEVRSVTVEGFELYHLSDPFLLGDGETVFFTATPNRKRRRDAVIYPGIFYGKYDGENNSITGVSALELNKTDEYGVMNPVLDEGSRKLYFTSNIGGGKGGYDLYYAEYDERWNFGKPINLGPTVNTGGNERDIFLSKDYLYFSSDGHGGYGGLDVYRIRLEATSVGRVENLGSPINTVSDDFGFRLVGDREAYLSSDRVDGQGYDDLYHLTWTDRNLRFRAMEGLVVETAEGLRISLDDLAELLYAKGEAEVMLSYPGYFRERRVLKWDQSMEEIALDLVEVPLGLEVYEAIIYYDFDKSDLRALSKERLNEITALMQAHPELHLVIESHTDSRATERYNERLSKRRSDAVSKYLEGNGVDKDRVQASWYSESRLANDCQDGKPCSTEEHQLNRRTELRLIAYPEGGKSYDYPKGSGPSDFRDRDSSKDWFLRANKPTD